MSEHRQVGPLVAEPTLERTAREEPEREVGPRSSLGRVVGAPVIIWLRRSGPALAVALGLLWLSIKGGGYALTVRSPAAIGIWAAIALGVAVSLWPRSRIPRTALVTVGLLGAFAALNGASAIWADSAEKAFIEFDRVALYVGLFTVVALAATRGSARQWSQGLAIGIVAVGLLSLSSRLFPDLFGPSAVARLDPDDPRLSYPLNYWNGLAVLMAVGLPLLLAAALQARTWLGRGLALAPFPALSAVIYLTSSRGGVLAAVVAIAVFVAFTSMRPLALATFGTALAGSFGAIAVLYPRDELVNGPLSSAAVAGQGRGAALLIVLVCAATALAYIPVRRVVPEHLRLPVTLKRGAVALALVLVVAGVVAADPSSRFSSLKEPPQEFGGSYTQSHIVSGGGSGRWQFWGSAIDQFQATPLLGGGAGSYEAWWAEHGTLSYFTRNAHSLFFETLGELGALGLILLLALLGVGLATAAGRLRASPSGDRVVVAALIGALLAFVLAAAIDWIWDLTVVGAIGVVCLALLVGPATVFRPDPGSRSLRRAEPRWRRHVSWRAGVALVALALVAAQGLPLATQLEVRASQRALKDGDAATALARAQDARKLQGWAASPHVQVALVEESRGRLGPALESIRRAIDRDPSDWRLWAVASRIEKANGAIAAARRSFDKAAALNPRSPLFR